MYVRCVIETCKHSVIDAAVPSIKLYRRKGRVGELSCVRLSNQIKSNQISFI